MKIRRPTLCALALMLTAGFAVAQPADPLRASVERALNSNPDVSARFNAYRASLAAVDVARAGYLPRVDLNAGAPPTCRAWISARASVATTTATRIAAPNRCR